MGSVQQAVLEFDDEVRAPWRPRLVAVIPPGDDDRRRRPASRNPSRVGACRPAVPLERPGSRERRGVLDPGVRPTPAIGTVGRAARGARDRSGTAGRADPVRLRLTRRARRLAVVLALAAGMALGSWSGALLGGGSGDLRLAGGSSVVVQSGDSLWSIARSVASDEEDVRLVVKAIQEINGLEGSGLVPGQVLVLP